MTELIIKSSQPEAAKAEIQAALESQRRVICHSIKRTQKNIATFEEKYGFSTAELFRREAQGTIDDNNLEFIEWLGETKLLGRLEDELKLLDEIQVC